MKIFIYFLEFVLSFFVIWGLNIGINNLLKKRLSPLMISVVAFVIISFLFYFLAPFVYSFPLPVLMYFPTAVFFFLKAAIKIFKSSL